MGIAYDMPTVQDEPARFVPLNAPESRVVDQLGPMSEAAGKLGEAFTKIEDMRATAAATQSDNELVSNLQNLTTQYNQLHGEEAVKARDAFLRLAQNKADEIKARSTSSIERDMVNRVFTQRLQSFNGHIDTSYVGQLDKWEKSEALGRVKNAATGLYNTWTSYDPKKPDTNYGKAKREMESFITAYTKREGMGPKAAEEFRIEVMSGEHKKILTAMISNNQAEMAKEYFKQHTNEIETGDRTRLDDVVKKAGAEQEGLNLAQVMKGRLLKGEDLNKLKDEAFKKLGGGEGGTLRSEAWKIFQSQFDKDHSDIDKSWRDEALLMAMPLNKAILKIEAEKGRMLTPKELYGIREYTDMRTSPNPYAVKEANRFSDEVTREYNTEVRFNKQVNAAANAAARQARKEQIQYQSALTLADYNKNPRKLVGLTDAQKSAIEVSLDPSHRGQWKTLVENTTSQKALTSLELTQQQFDNVFKEMGWTDKAKIAAGRNAATTYLLNEQKEKGYHFDKATAMKALAAAVAEVEVKKVGGNWFTSTMKIPLMDVKHKGNIVIPKEDLATIKADLEKLGIANPTTGQITELYSDMLADRKRGK